ncbi:MAG: hypothetical protein OXI81_20935 [Paracoccaceae bacterium]|nr:hypothetical protein [Paracoccaceae bacterium]MDE2913984.1 hypothetical protein [Paracoccaceae bacterium]
MSIRVALPEFPERFPGETLRRTDPSAAAQMAVRKGYREYIVHDIVFTAEEIAHVAEF